MIHNELLMSITCSMITYDKLGVFRLPWYRYDSVKPLHGNSAAKQAYILFEYVHESEGRDERGAARLTQNAGMEMRLATSRTAAAAVSELCFVGCCRQRHAHLDYLITTYKVQYTSRDKEECIGHT